MAPRQSSKSLATRPETVLAVAVTPTTISRDSAAMVSERNFYKNKTRLLEQDLLRLKEMVVASGGTAVTPEEAFNWALERARAGNQPARGRGSPNPAAMAEALASQAAHHAAALQRQAASHQLAMARSEVRTRQEADRADALNAKFTALSKLQRSPPYRVAKRISRWGRFWKRLGRRLKGPAR